MVASRNVPLYTGHLMPAMSSDHYPVEFAPIRLEGRAGYAIGSYSAYGGQERVLDISQNDSTNGTHVIVYDNHNGGNQHFNFVPTGNGNYTIRNQSTNKCLDLHNGTSARAGDYVNEWDCQGQRTQEWGVGAWEGDPGAAAIFNVSTGMCLDVFRNGTGNGTWTDIWPCTGTQNQKWTLEYLGDSLTTSGGQPQAAPRRFARTGSGRPDGVRASGAAQAGSAVTTRAR